MTRIPTVRATDLNRSIAALQKAGIPIRGILHKPNGEALVLTGAPMPDQDSAPVSELDAWREARRDGARAIEGS